MIPAMVKNDSTADLEAMALKLIARLQAVGRIGYERDRLSGESRCDLDELQFGLAFDLKVIREELRERERLLPTPITSTEGIDVFDLSKIA